jgi:hypothetical protein
MTRADAEHTGVVPECPQVLEGAGGHRYLPVLAVLASRREVTAEVLAIRLEDVTDQLSQLGIPKVLELADLAVAESGQTPSWL